MTCQSRKNELHRLKCVFYVIIVLGFAALATMIVMWVNGRALSAKPQQSAEPKDSQAVAVLRNLAAGKPVTMTDYLNTFGPGIQRSPLINLSAKELGTSDEEILQLVLSVNLAVVYVGPKDKIPVTLRPTTRPAPVATMPAEATTRQ